MKQPIYDHFHLQTRQCHTLYMNLWTCGMQPMTSSASSGHASPNGILLAEPRILTSMVPQESSINQSLSEEEMKVI